MKTRNSALVTFAGGAVGVVMRQIVAATIGAVPAAAQSDPVRAVPVSAPDAPEQAVWQSEPHLNVIPRTEAESARIDAVTRPADDFSAPEPFEQNPGGAATTRFIDTAEAFSQFSPNMPFEHELDFKVGNGIFRKLWVGAPSSTKGSDGLGPLYNARACQNCHIKDGRGHLPDGPDDSRVSAFLRLSVMGGDDIPAIPGYIPTLPDPVYGGQLQDLSLEGYLAEAKMGVAWTESTVTLADGEAVTLRRPHYSIDSPAYGAPDEGLLISPRVAPQMIGLGLIEAIPAADIIARADPGDADGDGISGRPQIVWSSEFGQPMLGRFGHKAGNATIREQSASAFAGDMGLSTPLFPDPSGECTETQSDCRSAPPGQEPGIRDGLEVDTEALDLVTFYSRNLAVPERRNLDDPQVLRGKEIAYSIGCTSCHSPKYVTNRLKDQPEQSFQLIWPYSDLLLHDMGEGLADNRPESRATGREWRTAPLWGISLNKQVTGTESYLHDGRARTLLEAILWHGGEAETARNAVTELPKEDRDALIAWLKSL
ncbi:di-heme oxidoredictase family protein [Paracoccus aerodenitrificans]|uniref:di-heme oxidoreductase family protein n=1 Tax=Paracoccus aerodenitrificans TaxID=3017781 RepID=UPI0022F11EBD|nr:di-heme oxidoredictase family protein [Paracoccus aerodenitrificans]WBU65283.1 thiol oxidoreductase [Paracoccus aerodenitrificans]